MGSRTDKERMLLYYTKNISVVFIENYNIRYFYWKLETKTYMHKYIYTAMLLCCVVLSACNSGGKGNSVIENSQETYQTTEILKGELLYENTLATESEVKDWVMEGPGVSEFKDNWMHMYAPDEEFHHVLWCPEDFPGSFVAEWELQNQKTDAGLCIVFFAAKGNNGESIFDPSFPKREGVFKRYTKSKYFNNYHISYYANGKDTRAREVAHLRKNRGFDKVQVGEPGIPLESKKAHKIRLVKKDAHILCFVDDRKIIDWTDDGEKYGLVWQGGKIGFRQMKWTHFKYRNFRVWELEGN